MLCDRKKKYLLDDPKTAALPAGRKVLRWRYHASHLDSSSDFLTMRRHSVMIWRCGTGVVLGDRQLALVEKNASPPSPRTPTPFAMTAAQHANCCFVASRGLNMNSAEHYYDKLLFTIKLTSGWLCSASWLASIRNQSSMKPQVTKERKSTAICLPKYLRDNETYHEKTNASMSCVLFLLSLSLLSSSRLSQRTYHMQRTRRASY